ncbi:hypothetical protein GCM10023194_77890 [Planotetraspora phitsanulokensis]|uniref:Major facilitator superfamily (MFS) profile domain-containing protein n=1 Tax=Planotetraspora phitsanulokensis TaxID=575192 RepID=A0A8J3UEL6_9ACTN|nr:MFS transporter [Planotetraspora phitsanulokensis]GII43330.1 hypothetical protein Pph01_83330 [Planotetraspora phitsanulokensis]
MIKKVSMITPKGMRGRYALVEFLTWLPVGLMIAPMVLLMSVRGLDVAQIGLVTAAYSITVVVLELPTGGLADVIGRRTVLAASAVFSVAGFAMTALAGSVWMFLAASLLKGVARALSSGPAQAWYVDGLHSLEGPDADLKPGLAAGGAAGSVALAIGTLVGGVLPLLVSGESLAVPVWAGGGAALILLFTVLLVMREPARPVRPRLADVVRDVPVTIGGGFRLAVHDRGLGRLLFVAVAVGVMLNAIELLTPGRLAALTGRPETAGTIYAVVAAAGFAANAVGSSIAPAVARLAGGSMRAVMIATVATAASVGALAASVALDGVAGMAAAGAAYVVLFTGLAVSSLFRNELIHRRVASTQRATVMSVDSLQLQFGGMLSSLVLVPLSAQVGAGGAWAVTAVIMLSATLLYVRLPAARAAVPVPVGEPQ